MLVKRWISQHRIATVLASTFFGLVSLYTGLWGSGNIWNTFSACSGTVSLALAILPALISPKQNTFILQDPDGSRAQDDTECAESSTLDPSAALIKSIKLLLSNDELMGHATRLKGAQAALLGYVLQKFLKLPVAQALDERARITASSLARGLADAERSLSSTPATPNNNRSRVLTMQQVRALRRNRREILAIQGLRHPNISAFLGAEDESAADTKLVPAAHANPQGTTSLTSLITISEIVAGLSYLHSLPEAVIHGDLRATSIIYDPLTNRSMLQLPIRRWESALHNPNYHLTDDDVVRHVAPEMIASPASWSESITKSTDIYALSMLLVEIITNATPHADIVSRERVKEVVSYGQRPRTAVLKALPLFFERIRPSSTTGVVEFVQNNPIDKPMKGLYSLMEIMWDHNPMRRPSIQQVESRIEELSRFEELA